MYHGFKILLITGLLIVLAAFCFVFSFDRRKTVKCRKILLGIAVILFILIIFLVIRILESPLC